MGDTTEFRLTIRIGNDEMSTSRHVAHALIRQANLLRQRGIDDFPHAVSIMDANGNRVGQWKFTEVES